MSSSLDILQAFFETGTAEGDVNILSSVFVRPREYYDIMEPPLGSPRLLVGKKGSGKSALVEMIRQNAEKAEIPSLLIRPDDIEISFPSQANDISTLKRIARTSLIQAMASKLASNTNGLLSGDDLTIVRSAVKNGDKEPDGLQKFLSVIMPIAKATSGIDFEKMLNVSSAGSDTALRNAVIQKIKNSEKIFYLLIDDTDQLAAPNSGDQLNRIWAFLLAARDLTSKIVGLRCIINLRSEVWVRLKSEHGGQRDQIDHFRPLVVETNSTDDYLEKIFLARLVSASEKLGSNSEFPIEIFFEGKQVILPRSGEETRLWQDHIIKSSRERPRDVIQYTGMLINEARRKGKTRIDSSTVADCLAEFSKERVDDICLEFDKDCPQLRAIIDSFAAMTWVIPGESVENHLSSQPSATSTVVRGVALQPYNRDHTLVLWRLLYEAGILNPRLPDNRNPLLYRHGSFREDPNLVSIANYHRARASVWEIHPAYRSYLQDKQEERAAKAGITRHQLIHKGKR